MKTDEVEQNTLIHLQKAVYSSVFERFSVSPLNWSALVSKVYCLSENVAEDKFCRFWVDISFYISAFFSRAAPRCSGYHSHLTLVQTPAGLSLHVRVSFCRVVSHLHPKVAGKASPSWWAQMGISRYRWMFPRICILINLDCRDIKDHLSQK